ncbi:MAG: formimidoylglutamase [Flavobacteriales bacterium]
MELKYYQVTDPELWTGRVDHPTDPDAARFHQAVKLIHLDQVSEHKVEVDKKLFAILGFCCDEGVRRNQGRVGAAEGPFKIRKELAKLPANFNLTSELIDVGNIICVDQDMEGAQAELALAVAHLLNHGITPLVLGGGHEIVYGHYLGVATHSEKHSNTPPLLINLDAHFDLRPVNEKGTSGTSFNQIAEKHQAEGKPFDYICIGTQTYGNTRSLYARADELGVDYYDAKDITEHSKAEVLLKVLRRLQAHDSVYLTLDFDVLNAANAPGVSSPQPFGISPDMMLYFVKPILQTGKVMSIDIAEVSPRYDDDNQTAKLAAVVFYSMLNVLGE